MGLLSAVITLVTWIAYFARVPSGNVPVRPVFSVLAQSGALALAVASVVWPSGGGWWMVVDLAGAGLGAMGATLFLWLLTQRRTPVGELRVQVGDRLLPFEVATDTGTPLSTEQLAGRRVLLKFFRGHW